MLKQPSDDQPRQRDSAVLARGAAEEGTPCADWVEAQYSRLELLLCSPADPPMLARFLLHELAPLVNAAQGAAYVLSSGDASSLVLAGGYAAGDSLPARVAVGEGLLGQCAADRRKLLVRGVSADHFRIHSALGSSAPAALAFVPVALDDGALVVVELAWFGAREPASDMLLDRLAERRPREGAGGLQEKGPSPSGGASPAERSPSRVAPTVPAPARQSFWSTLSHELRSPLNSVIVLSHVLAENAEHNLSDKQVNLARVIHGSGKDLLALVDNISLLTKIEAQRLVLSLGTLELDALRQQMLRMFQPLASARGLRLSVELDADAPDVLLTDGARVRQIVECMLATGIERGERAGVRLRIGPRRSGWSPDRQRLNGARGVLALALEVDPDGTLEPSALDAALDHERSAGGADGPAANEPDLGASSPGSLARGGALGLAISRELATLLGGELQHDEAHAASILYLPLATWDRHGAQAIAGGDDAALARAAEPPGAGSDAVPPARAMDVPHASPATGEGESRRWSLAAPLGADALEGLEILLVDPDVRQAFTLTGQLERQGAVVAHTEDLAELVERLRGGRPPSAVLLDARVLGASPEASVRRLLRLAEQTPFVVLREAGDTAASMPRVHRVSRSADPREVVALLRRVAVPASSLHTRAP